MAKGHGATLTEEELSAAMLEMDANQDGDIDLQEFSGWMRGQQQQKSKLGSRLLPSVLGGEGEELEELEELVVDLEGDNDELVHEVFEAELDREAAEAKVRATRHTLSHCRICASCRGVARRF